MKSLGFSLLFFICAAASASAAVIDVTTCGQVVPRGHQGVLVGDLDCTTASPYEAVVLERGARLLLGGHTLSGDPLTGSADGVACEAPCRVQGPGTITGFQVGVAGGRSVRLTDIDLIDNQYGAVASRRLIAAGVSVSGSAIGLNGGGAAVKLTGSDVHDNTWGVDAKRVVARDSTVTDNEIGILVRGGTSRLVDTQLDNTQDPSHMDIRAGRTPRLAGTSACLGRSLDYNSGSSFGICALD